MADFRKLVSTVLMLLIPTVSALALTACRESMPNMDDPHEHMQVMGVASPDLTFSAATNNLCCEIAPAEAPPGPPTRPSVTGNGSANVLNAAPLVKISKPNEAKRPDQDVRCASSPPQALLCVFLI